MNRLVLQGRTSILPVLLTLIVTVGCNPGAADGYVLPPEQIVRFMTENFSPIQTLEVVQTVEAALAEEDSPRVFEERMWLKAPASYAVERMVLERPTASAGQGSVPLYIPRHTPVQPSASISHRGERQAPVVFRRFLMANTVDAVMDVFMELGVDTGSSGLDRVDGGVAYRIGTDNPGSPQVLIDKETFLPLMLRYEASDPRGAAQWTVRFGDYRKCDDEGWYPHEIVCSSGSGITEIYRITSLKVNVSVQRPLAEIPILPPPANTRTPESRQDRLQPTDSGFR